MSSPSRLDYIWMNGKLVPQAQAVLPVDSAAVFYATNVFEGLRAYWNDADEELYCFRLEEHFIRIRESMKMMRFTVSYSTPLRKGHSRFCIWLRCFASQVCSRA